MHNQHCRHISAISPTAPKHLFALLNSGTDAFASSVSARGRMKPDRDCFVLVPSSSSSTNHQISLKTLLFPLRPSKGACNVYGSVHGGALWSFSDIASTLHLSLFLNFSKTKESEELFYKFKMTNASCRYHNGVAQDSPLVCVSTIVSFPSSSLDDKNGSAHFYVDLVPEKYTPLKFDADNDEWKIRSEEGEEEESHVVSDLSKNSMQSSSYLSPDSTFTRATFTKVW